MHGVGAALVGKIMRRALLAEDTAPSWARIGVLDLNSSLARDKAAVVVEVPQGLSLSLVHGPIPRYTTSRDCWVGSALSDAGIHPTLCGPVAIVCRTFPIRVGSVYNENGELIGHSGPFYKDSIELSWEKDLPNFTPELTTVTKRVRRIATWSDEQYAYALRMNRPSIVFLSFCNYLADGLAFQYQVARMRRVEEICGWPRGVIHHLYSFTPYTDTGVYEDYAQALSWFDRKTEL
jgi:hypothetical protein